MSLGTTGYAIYLGSLWSFQLHGTRWFVILAGAILGVCGAVFWAAQGSIMMAYPLEKDKGRSFTVFWAIFQLGTLIGAAIALGIQFRSTLPGVSTGVYVTFLTSSSPPSAPAGSSSRPRPSSAPTARWSSWSPMSRHVTSSRRSSACSRTGTYLCCSPCSSRPTTFTPTRVL